MRSDSRQKRLICLTGIDGVGKSTLLDHLVKAIPDAKLVSIWDLLRERDLHEPIQIPFQDAAGADQFLRSLSPHARSEFLMGCWKQAIDRGLRAPETTILIDAYWYKYYAYETAILGDRIEADLKRLVQPLPRSHLLFSLELEPRLALARKGEYSGYETGFAPVPSEEAYVEFQTRFAARLHSLTRGLGAHQLDGRRPIDENLAECLRVLEQV